MLNDNSCKILNIDIALTGLQECQEAYSPYPNALLSLRFIITVGRIILSDTQLEPGEIKEGDNISKSALSRPSAVSCVSSLYLGLYTWKCFLPHLLCYINFDWELQQDLRLLKTAYTVTNFNDLILYINKLQSHQLLTTEKIIIKKCWCSRVWLTIMWYFICDSIYFFC